MKHFVILVGACLVGLAGCVIETTSGSNGGSAGSTSTAGAAGGGVGGGTAGATSAGGTSTGGSTSAGGTGGGGGGACVTCGDYVTNGGTLCEGASTDLYNALADCTCAGACMDICADNVCAGMDVTSDCQTCVLDATMGCGNEFTECANDI